MNLTTTPLRLAALVILSTASLAFGQAQVEPDHLPPDNVWWDWSGTWTMDPGSTATIDLSGAGSIDMGASATFDAITGGDSSLGITGLAVTGGTGGAVVVTGGATTTSGVGGAVTLAGGAGSGASAGGAITVTSGAGATTGASGAVTVGSAVGQSGTTGTAGASGSVSILANTGGSATTGTGGASGNITLLTGAGGATSGAGGTGGAAGKISLTAGAGGADGEGASGTGGAGGAVVLTAGAGGAGNTAGIGGQVHLRSSANTPVLTKRAVAGTGTDLETLTVAELFNGIFVQTPSAGTTTCTTPTGAQISAALGSSLAVGDSFEFTLINAGATTYDITFTAGATGVTVTGNALVYPAADAQADHSNSSGTWVFVNTAADTWIAYRK